MASTSKAQKEATRRGLFRSSIELPMATWRELQAALQKRAAIMKQTHGVEVNGSFHSWLREKAEETIKAYK